MFALRHNDHKYGVAANWKRPSAPKIGIRRCPRLAMDVEGLSRSKDHKTSIVGHLVNRRSYEFDEYFPPKSVREPKTKIMV